MSDKSIISLAETAGPLLAIDSSSDQAGLALFDGASIAELSWPAARTQTATLLAEIQHMLTLRGFGPGDLAAVAVATGPGSFTGVRVALSVAKGLALGLRIPTIGVPTLAAAALPHLGPWQTVIPVVAAGRGRLLWAVYGPAGGEPGQSPRLVAGPRNGTFAELREACRDTGPGAVVTGELTTQNEHLLVADGSRVAAAALRHRRPAAVALLGWQRFVAGDTDDPATLDQIYLAP